MDFLSGESTQFKHTGASVLDDPGKIFLGNPIARKVAPVAILHPSDAAWT
jgi:hypothetical protein